MFLLLEDVLIASRTVYGEARGEPKNGKLAVAHVLINRWKRTDGQFAKDDTLATTCLRHLQFSIWNAGDPNFVKIHQVQIDNDLFRECLRCVLEAIDEPDFTSGSTHYHTIAKPMFASDWPPVWAQGHVPVLTLGAHAFYNDIP